MRVRTVTLFVGFLSLTSVFLPGSLWAAEGRIPIFEPVILDGTVSNIEGKYILVRNLERDDGSLIIVIGTGTESVEIDLNGFSLSRTDNGKVFLAQNVKSLVLKNGSLSSIATSGRIVEVKDTPSSGEVIIQGLKISGGGTGIKLDGVPNFQVRDNIVVASGVHGILIEGQPDTEFGGVIERNVIKDTVAFGLWVGADGESKPRGVIVRGNRVEGIGLEGIAIKNTRNFIIEKNTVSQTQRSCIKVQESAVGSVIGNVVFECGLDDVGTSAGIRLSDGPASDCLIAENSASGSKGAGIFIEGDGNQIERNVFNHNEDGGLIIIGNQNTIGRNTGRFNGGAPTCTAPEIGQCASPNFCDSGSGNSSFGDNFMPGPC